MATALRFRPLDAFYNVLNPVPFGFFVAAWSSTPPISPRRR